MALLWDLDNVAPRQEHVESLAHALSTLVDRQAPRIAAGHRQTYRRWAGPLHDLGIRVLSGGRRPNGADRVLLQQAGVLHEQGVERFLVATNDHRFARIATFADLHVATLTVGYVSRALRSAARSITVLEHAEAGWRPLHSPVPGTADPQRRVQGAA